MAKTDITPEGMEAQIQQEAPKAATQKNLKAESNKETTKEAKEEKSEIKNS